jgi:hypothetical protein
MQWKRWMLLLALLSVAGLGCGGSSGDSTPPTESDAEETAAATSPRLEPPAAAVAEFLGAVRVGDDAKAASMFTPAARVQVAQLGYQVAPTKSDTATFAVGEVQYLEGGGARVVAKWTDLGKTDEMLWMLRSEPEGWRIAGMAAEVFPGEPPLLLNFENLEEAMGKIRMLRETIEQREARLQAQQPADPQGAIRR